MATLGSELFHSTLSMVASSGISLGVYSQLLPSFLFFWSVFFVKLRSVTSDAANVPVAGVAIEPASLILCEGEEKTLNALVDPANPLVTTTVMVVLPGWFPRVTTPVTGAALAAVDAVTVATLGSELFHSTLS